jgi:hypothetical protein
VGDVGYLLCCNKTLNKWIHDQGKQGDKRPNGNEVTSKEERQRFLIVLREQNLQFANMKQ